MFIAVEGMDGVGKTTISKMLAEQCGLLYVEKPMQHLLKNTDKEYDELCYKIWDYENENIKLCFFALGNLLSRHFAKDVVVDRHILSSYFWDSNENNQAVFYQFAKGDVIPDLTFMLYSSLNTRNQRMKKRNENDQDLEDEVTQSYGYDKMLNFANEINLPYVIIDTENKTIDEVFNLCLDVIDDLKNNKYRNTAELCDHYNQLFFSKNQIRRLERKLNNEENINWCWRSNM